VVVFGVVGGGGGGVGSDLGSLGRTCPPPTPSPPPPPPTTSTPGPGRLAETDDRVSKRPWPCLVGEENGECLLLAA